MLIWSALATAGLTGLTVELLTTGVPEWARQAAEVLAVVAVFLLVCLIETGGSRSDKSNA